MTYKTHRASFPPKTKYFHRRLEIVWKRSHNTDNRAAFLLNGLHLNLYSLLHEEANLSKRGAKSHLNLLIFCTLCLGLPIFLH